MDARTTIAGLLDRAKKAEAEASNREAKVRELEGVIAMLHAEHVQCAARCRAMTAVVDAAREIPARPSPVHRLLTPGWKELREALAKLDAWRNVKGEDP